MTATRAHEWLLELHGEMRRAGAPCILVHPETLERFKRAIGANDMPGWLVPATPEIIATGMKPIDIDIDLHPNQGTIGLTNRTRAQSGSVGDG